MIEHTDATLALGVKDVDHLLGLSTRWRFVRTAPGGKVTINPGSTVGVLRLPSGTQLEMRPKVSLRNLLWMLSEVRGISLTMLPEQVSAERFDEVVELLADTFARMVERRIDLGLYRNYVEEEGDLSVVRGRIVVAQNIHRNAVLRHRTYCRYTSYSWNLPENQVVRQVVGLLARWGFSRELTGRLLALDHQMGEIAPGQFAAEDIDRFTYTRQSEDYRPIHRLCRLFLESASLSEQYGGFAIDGFLLDMNTLYEQFITTELSARLHHPFRVHAQFRTSLDAEGVVQIRPDIVITRYGDVVLVADCKYKVLGSSEHLHPDLYQIHAYTTALGVQEGVLIYPRHLVDLGGTVKVRNAGVRLRETTIDLGGPLPHMRAELDALARRIERWLAVEMTAPGAG